MGPSMTLLSSLSALQLKGAGNNLFKNETELLKRPQRACVSILSGSMNKSSKGILSYL